MYLPKNEKQWVNYHKCKTIDKLLMHDNSYVIPTRHISHFLWIKIYFVGNIKHWGDPKQ